MPLTPCPDCGREISTEAPACIHCGRPLAPAASASRPMAGIVAALLFGAATLILVMLVTLDPYYPDEIVRLTWASRIALVLGNLALIVAALMSLAGNRRGHDLARTVSKAMIAVVVALLMAWWWAGAGQPLADGDSEKPSYFPLVAAAAVVFIAPWWLCLYLFRTSRHPWMHLLHDARMRTATLLGILAPLALAACAGAGASYAVTYRADAPTSRHVLPFPADAVWAALPLAYADLQLPAGPTTRDRLEFTTPQLRVKDQLYGRRNSDFIDCGVVDGGQPLENHGEVFLAMITRLESAAGGTVVQTQVDAYARRRDVANDPVRCTTRGVLEEALVSALLARLRPGAAP